VYAHILNIGFNNVHIILIEEYPCSNKDELVRRERYWVDELKPLLNTNQPICFKEEYRQHEKRYCASNHELELEWNKHYRANNRDAILEKKKLYDEKNQESILEKKKVYRAKNQESILEKKKVNRAEKKSNQEYTFVSPRRPRQPPQIDR
jgi:hypothetical protein